MALMGGVAIAVALLVGVMVGRAGGGLPLWTGGSVWIGAALVFLVGFVDDRWGISPTTKIVAQVLATVCVLYAGHAFWRGAPAEISIPLTFFWVIGVTNAVNLIDGIDGLAASIAAVAAAALAVASATVGLSSWAIVGAAIAGASLGFLPYNAPPARIFMGDCGSLLLGYSLATISLAVQGSGGPVAGTLIPVVVLAVPVFDTTFVTVTRLLRGQSVAEGGNDHTHHRLIALGLSEGRATAVLAVVSVVFGSVALSTLWIPPALAIAVVLIGFVGCAVAGGYLRAATTPGDDPTAGPDSLSARFGALFQRFFGGVQWKSVLGVGADLAVVGASFVIALHLRYGGAPPEELRLLTYRGLPAIIGVKLIVFYAFGLYRGIWRHAGTPEIVRLLAASALSTLLSLAGWALWTGELPVALFVIDWMVATAAVGSIRFLFRALRQSVAAHVGDERRALIYGSGAIEVLLVRYLRHHPRFQYAVAGLLDEDPSRHGRRLQGTTVLGAPEDLPRLCEVHDVEEVIVPVYTTTAAEREALQDQCVRLGVDCQLFSVALRPPGGSDPTLLEVGDGMQADV